MNKLDHKYQDKAWELLKTLYPISRTILGEGYLASLDAIGKIVPLKMRRYVSGSKCGSWVIPQEWQVKEAYIADKTGRRVVDVKNNFMHLWQYSAPFRGTVSRGELLEHVSVCEQNKNAIPLGITFYKKNWGFSLSARQLSEMCDDQYTVCVDTEFKNSELVIGECFLPGEKKQEIILDAVLSCSSVANNLSGVVVAVLLTELLKQQPHLKYSYRVLLTPETIGPLALCHLDAGLLKNAVGGYTFVNLADKSGFNYRASRMGNTVADKAMKHVLNFCGESQTVEDFDVKTGTCGNEKAYNSLGFEIPVGSIRRSHLGSYPEYDTSKDDLNFVSKENLFKSLQLCWNAIQAIERCEVYKHTFTGEPFLTGYGIFPKIQKDEDRVPFDYLMGFADGEMDLIEIADKAKIPVTQFDEALSLMVSKGLLKKV